MLFYNIFFFPLSVPHHRQLPIYFLSLYISLYLLEPYTNGIMQCVFFFLASFIQHHYFEKISHVLHVSAVCSFYC